MWDYFYARRALEFGHPFDGVNSPFAFPHLPPRANPPLGISNTARIKDSIVHDNEQMIARLTNHQATFQRYARGLFNFTPLQFVPGHPMGKKFDEVSTLQEENEKLRQENSTLRASQRKEKRS